MFIGVFILILCIITLFNNEQNEITGENADSYKFDKYSIFIILGLIILGIILDIIMKNFRSVYYIVLLIYAVLNIILLIVANQLRIQSIEKEREQIDQIYEIFSTLLKVKKDEIDYNNIPFNVDFDSSNKKYINKITVTMENPERFTDSSVTQAVYSMNKFLPYKKWVSEVDFPERECIFIGNKLPPLVANFPGSDLRPWNFIPVGLSGTGEIAWNLGADKKSIGKSLYIYEDTGLNAETTDSTKSPQCLMVGTTGGGKAIFIEQKVEIINK